MQGIGNILREQREKMNITLDMVADATKIRKKYLTAIEEEKFEVLPGEVYARGFVTAYLKYLGIKDREDVVKIMSRKVQIDAGVAEGKSDAAQHEKNDGKAEKKQTESSHFKTDSTDNNEGTAPRVPFNAATTEQNLRSRRYKKKKISFEEIPITKKVSRIVIITLVAVALLLGINWGYNRFSGSEEDQLGPAQQVENQNPETGEIDTAEPQDGIDGDAAGAEGDGQEAEKPEQPKYSDLQMTIRVLDITPNQNDQCWMQITVDGTAMEETMSQGQEKQIVAKDSITLNLGNAGAVSVTINGQDLGVQGAKGKVVKKTFNLADYIEG